MGQRDVHLSAVNAAASMAGDRRGFGDPAQAVRVGTKIPRAIVKMARLRSPDFNRVRGTSLISGKHGSYGNAKRAL